MSNELTKKEQEIITHYLDNLSPDDGDNTVKYSKVLEDLFKEYESAEISSEAVDNSFLEHLSSQDPEREVSVDQVKADAGSFGIEAYKGIQAELEQKADNPENKPSEKNKPPEGKKHEQEYSGNEKKAIKNVMIDHLMKAHKADMDKMKMPEDQRRAYLEEQVDSILDKPSEPKASPNNPNQGAMQVGKSQSSVDATSIANIVGNIMGGVGGVIKETLSRGGQGLNYLKNLKSNAGKPNAFDNEGYEKSNADLACNDITDYLDNLTEGISQDIDNLSSGEAMSREEKATTITRLGKALKKVKENSQLLATYKNSPKISEDTKNDLRRTTESVEGTMEKFEELGNSKKEKELKSQAEQIKEFVKKLIKSLHKLFYRDKGDEPSNEKSSALDSSPSHP